MASSSAPPRRPLRRLSPVLREMLLAFGTGAVATVIGILALRITPSELATRWTTGSDDQILHYMVATSATRSALYLPNELLGYPDGQNLFFAPIFDPASALTLGIFSLVIHNGILLLNVFYLFTFLAVGITGYLALRVFRVRRATSVLFAVTFALAPYHFQRIAMGHGFVSNYWAIPLVAVAVALVCGLDTPLERWVIAGPSRRGILRRRAALIVAVMLPISLTLNYYSVFAIILLLGILIFRFVATRLSGTSIRELRSPAVAVGALVLFVGVQLALLSLNFGERYAHYFAVRSVGESELYGGKITSLLLPWTGSELPVLGSFSRAYAAGSSLLRTSEPPGTPIIATIAMVLMATLLIARAVMKRTAQQTRFLDDERLGAMSGVFLWGLLFFLSGGLGAIFAGLVSGDIRAWSRMSILLIMFAIVFAAVLFDLALKAIRWQLVGAVVILAVVAVDQIAGVATYLPLKPTTDTALKAFVSDVDRDLPNGCGVVELPLKSFPESGPIDRLQDYDEALPYLYTNRDDLKWSYGAVRGTFSGDYWSKVRTTSQFAAAVTKSRACAIVVDTYGYTDSATWEQLVTSVTDDVADAQSEDLSERYLMFRIDG